MRDLYATWDANLNRATDNPDGWPDKAIVPYVQALRDTGVRTFQSCAGHDNSDGHLWFQAHVPARGLLDLLSNQSICRLTRMYKPEDCWEIVWNGELYPVMALLFMVLGVPLPRMNNIKSPRGME